MKLKKYLLKKEILFLIMVTFILIYKVDFPKKFYNLINLNYDQRLIKTYGYCSNYSVGFIREILQKYNLKEFNIVKFTGSRNPYWIFPSIRKDSKSEYFLLKYNFINEVQLENIDNQIFRYNFSYKHKHKKLKKLSFSIAEIKNLHRIDIYNEKGQIFQLKSENFTKKDDKYEVRFSKKLIDSFLDNNYDEDNFFFKPIYQSKKKTNLINNMKIYLSNIYDLNDFKIIEQFEDCYYVKKIYE